MKKILCVVCSLWLMACSPVSSVESTDFGGGIGDAEESVSIETTADATEENSIQETPGNEGNEVPISETIPLPEGTALTETELAEYQVYFGQYGTWYTQALTSFYATPESIDLHELFYNGFPGGDQPELTDEEDAYLRAEWADHYFHDGMLDTDRLPVTEMDTVLQQYFGITIEEAHGVGLDRMPYWEETDCYYSYRGDTNSMKATLRSGMQLEDGCVALFYTDDWRGECMITVRPVESDGQEGEPGGIQILSHVPTDVYDLFYQESAVEALTMEYLELLDLRYPLRGEAATGYEDALAQLPLAEGSKIPEDFAHMSEYFLEDQKWRKDAYGESMIFLTEVESVYEIQTFFRRGDQYEVYVRENTVLHYAANPEWEAYDQWETTQWHTILIERQPDGSLSLLSDEYHSQDDRLPCSVYCQSSDQYGVHIKGAGSIENLVDSYVKLWDLCHPLENQLPTVYRDLLEELPVVRSSNIYRDCERFGQYYLEKSGAEDPVLHKVKSVYDIISVEQVDNVYEVEVDIFTYMGYSYSENGPYTDVMGLGLSHLLRIEDYRWEGLRLLSDTYHVDGLKHYQCSSDCTGH